MSRRSGRVVPMMGGVPRLRMGRLGAGLLALAAATPLLGQAAVPLAAPRAAVDYFPLSPDRSDEPVPLWGTERLGFYPRFGGQVVYDDNITLLKTNQLKDLILTFSPGLTLLGGETTRSVDESINVRNQDSGPGSGPGMRTSGGAAANRSLVTTSRGLSLDYASAFNYFSSHSDLNSVDHLARLNVAVPLDRISFRLVQDFQALSDAVLDVAARIQRRLYNTDLEAVYALTELTAVQADGRYNLSDYSKGVGSREGSLTATLNHQFTPRINLGFGGGAGWLAPDGSPVQPYQQVLVRIGYDLTDLVKANASGGLETRDRGSSASGSSPVSFVFNLGAAYTPSEQWQFGLIAGRRNQSSALYLGRDFSQTSVGVSGQYRPHTRVALYASASFDRLSYSSTIGGAALSSRSDDYLGLQIGAAFEIALHWAVGVFCQFRSNASSSDLYDYTSRQAGVTLSWAY